MSFYRLLLFLISLLLLAVFAYTQDTRPQIERVPAPATSAASGKEMFKSYCSSCHGPTAKGDGPAAPALKATPRDLTLLAKSNSGKFPSERVMSILRGQATVTAHGNRDMPVWGQIFRHMSSNQDLGAVRIFNLVKYIEQIQSK